MAENKVLDISTKIYITPPTMLVETGYFDSTLGNVLEGTITNQSYLVNGAEVPMGHLLMIFQEDSPLTIDIAVDHNTGELVALGSDADKYSIDTNGNLIYTQ